MEVGPELSSSDKIWRIFSAMGNIALACSYATVVFDIMVSRQKLYIYIYDMISYDPMCVKLKWIMCVHCLGHIEVISTRKQTNEKG